MPLEADTVNWVTADGCVVRSHRRIRRQSSRIHVHTADADATLSSRRRRRCVLGLTKIRSAVWSTLQEAASDHLDRVGQESNPQMFYT